MTATAEELQAKLDAILRHWEYGVGRLDSHWRIKMAELVGDTLGLEEMREIQEDDDPDGDPVGWVIVAIGDDGSVLCESKTGNRRRYWFGEEALGVVSITRKESDPK